MALLAHFFGSSIRSFTFLAPGPLKEGNLRLHLHETVPAQPNRVPVYRFEMRQNPDGVSLGRIELRVGVTKDLLLYTGHIGYRVDAAHRGQHYAARSCRLLFPFARAHGLRELWITCDPENLASRRTCELAGGVFENEVAVPKNHIFYELGSRTKCRYRLPL